MNGQDVQALVGVYRQNSSRNVLARGPTATGVDLLNKNVSSFYLIAH